jgi:hypothetical protein
VHRENATLGQQKVHDREDRLFQFACVRGAADQDQFPREVHGHEGFAASAVYFGVGFESWGLDQREFRFVVRQILRRGPHEKLSREQAVPGALVDGAQGKAKPPVGSGVTVLDEQVGALQIGEQSLMEALELVRVDGQIHVAPVHRRLGGFVAHNVAVARGATGVGVGTNYQGPIDGQMTFPPLDGLFN